jgi:hypothetical protein
VAQRCDERGGLPIAIEHFLDQPLTGSTLDGAPHTLDMGRAPGRRLVYLLERSGGEGV